MAEQDRRDIPADDEPFGESAGTPRRGATRNITWILATIGAAAAGYLAVTAYSRRGSGSRGAAPALSGREQDFARDFSATRSAGTGAMRDPPKEWTRADEASDESFPASDPPPVGSRVD